MILLTEKARKKLQESTKMSSEQAKPIWNITFLGFG